MSLTSLFVKLEYLVPPAMELARYQCIQYRKTPWLIVTLELVSLSSLHEFAKLEEILAKFD